MSVVDGRPRSVSMSIIACNGSGGPQSDVTLLSLPAQCVLNKRALDLPHPVSFGPCRFLADHGLTSLKISKPVFLLLLAAPPFSLWLTAFLSFPTLFPCPIFCRPRNDLALPRFPTP
ncbi:uncharacterized [Tachysurus ichikawai]